MTFSANPMLVIKIHDYCSRNKFLKILIGIFFYFKSMNKKRLILHLKKSDERPKTNLNYFNSTYYCA